MEIKNLKELTDTYIEVRKELEAYVRCIWDFLCMSYVEELDFEKDSTYYDFYVDKDWLTIRYHNDSDYDYMESDFNIPMEKILNGTWREYIVNLFN